MRVHNIIAYVGCVESASFALLIFEHNKGFASPKEALIELHRCMKSILEHFTEMGMWNPPGCSELGPDHNASIRKLVLELQGGWNDQTPAGYELTPTKRPRSTA